MCLWREFLRCLIKFRSLRAREIVSYSWKIFSKERYTQTRRKFSYAWTKRKKTAYRDLIYDRSWNYTHSRNFLYFMNRSIRLGWMDGWISRVSFRRRRRKEEIFCVQNRLINAYKDTFRTKLVRTRKRNRKVWRIKKRMQDLHSTKWRSVALGQKAKIR